MRILHDLICTRFLSFAKRRCGCFFFHYFFSIINIVMSWSRWIIGHWVHISFTHRKFISLCIIKFTVYLRLSTFISAVILIRTFFSILLILLRDCAIYFVWHGLILLINGIIGRLAIQINWPLQHTQFVLAELINNIRAQLCKFFQMSIFSKSQFIRFCIDLNWFLWRLFIAFSDRSLKLKIRIQYSICCHILILLRRFLQDKRIISEKCYCFLNELSISWLFKLSLVVGSAVSSWTHHLRFGVHLL